MNDSEILDAIAEMLANAEDWSSDHLMEIANLVATTGRKVTQATVIDSDDYFDVAITDDEFPDDPPAAEQLAAANRNRKFLGLEV